jgi:hypothetical protein
MCPFLRSAQGSAGAGKVKRRRNEKQREYRNKGLLEREGIKKTRT